MNIINGESLPQRLLCIVSSMNRGGAETFLMKVYRLLDKSKFQMDFCVTEPGEYDEEIKKMGGRIYNITAKSKNLFKSFFDIKTIVKKNKYNTVLRTSQQSLATIDLIAAKFGGAENLIYRSSNAGMTEKGFARYINSLFAFLPKIVPNIKLAPSTEAAEFVFGKKAVRERKVTIMPNALDYSMFEFDENKRNKIRRELKLEDKNIIGHVGRFNKQKNHDFLIDIFYELRKKNKSAHLLLIGKGELENEIRNKIEKLNLNEFVTIISPVANINEYYMAMDVLVFPSFFEGMPNVIVEAQATDLPCVISETITKEANITGKVIYKDINENAEEWAKVAIDSINDSRKSQRKLFSENNYDLAKNIAFYEREFFKNRRKK